MTDLDLQLPTEVNWEQVDQDLRQMYVQMEQQQWSRDSMDQYINARYAEYRFDVQQFARTPAVGLSIIFVAHRLKRWVDENARFKKQVQTLNDEEYARRFPPLLVTITNLIVLFVDAMLLIFMCKYINTSIAIGWQMIWCFMFLTLIALSFRARDALMNWSDYIPLKQRAPKSPDPLSALLAIIGHNKPLVSQYLHNVKIVKDE